MLFEFQNLFSIGIKWEDAHEHSFSGTLEEDSYGLLNMCLMRVKKIMKNLSQ
jgi:hypothetical protein